MSIEALKLLCSATKLDRDRGMQDVQKYLTTASANEIKCLETDVLRILEDAKSKPESKLGGLLAIKAILCHLRPVQYQGKDILSEKVARLCLELLSDPEVRVRIEAGQVLGVLCTNEGVKVYEKHHSRIIHLIEASLEGEMSEIGPSTGPSTPEEIKDEESGHDISSAARVLLNTMSPGNGGRLWSGL